MAYLDRLGEAPLAGIRPLLASASGRPVTFGWGPRFLHSTGQYHKGGPQVGAFLQVTGVVTDDLDVPGQPYSFGQLQAAQAAGDRQALSGRGRPLLWLHLTDRTAGAAQLLDAARSLATA
jgi:glucose-6-phosphate isomerase